MFSTIMRAMHRPIYQRRLRVLVQHIVSHLHADDHVLDVGCGFGELGRAILDHPECPDRVHLRGLERVRRGDELIDVTAYDDQADTRCMPFEDNSHDVVIVADVLHHEPDPSRLLAECVRVSRRLVIIKDHQVKGPLAQQRISLIDWAANAPYGVPCLYRYNTPTQWADVPATFGLEPVEVLSSMRLYPPLVNLLFGGSLQYMAVMKVPGANAE